MFFHLIRFTRLFLLSELILLSMSAQALHCTDILNKKLNPLGPHQWHLYAYGDSAFATPLKGEERLAAIGQDINAYTVLKEYCLSGHGVNVAVVDSGLQLAHPSLAPNIDNRPYTSATWSINFRNNQLSSNDPSPIESDEDDHGTMVAGLIGMRSNLGFGGSGVAPRSRLTGYNAISQDTQNFQNLYESLGGSDASKNNHIFNLSYVSNSKTQISREEPLELASLAMYRTGTRLLRNGKGAIYVKSAGNGFKSLAAAGDFTSCESALKYFISCQNSSMNPDNTVPEVITVGALDVFGKKASYSTSGASLWVSAPGGEYGYNKVWVDAQFARLNEELDWWEKFRPTIGYPAVISTDMVGSYVGNSHKINIDDAGDIFNIRNAFNAGLVPENPLHNYTSSMNGTSAATPIVSGAIAILLEANPKLTWRDIKYILARTATKTDPQFSGVKAHLEHGEYEFEQGWVTNAAGFHFSNWYGFGRVNLKEAVDMALSYDSPLGHLYIERAWWPKSKALNLDIPSDSYFGVTQILNIPNTQNLTIESVQILTSIESEYVGDIALEVTSPSGTKNIVWHAGNGFASNTNLTDMIMQSNAFYGEQSAGDWMIRAVNTGIHHAQATWLALQIKITGY
jgi:subtilisin family serine protease